MVQDAARRELEPGKTELGSVRSFGEERERHTESLPVPCGSIADAFVVHFETLGFRSRVRVVRVGIVAWRLFVW